MSLVVASACTSGVSAQESVDASSIARALRDSTFDLALQYRYEHVDQQGFAANANASVLRTRLTFETARLSGFSVTLEADDLRAVGADGFNSTRNGKTDRPTVADSTATDLNQLFVRHVSASGLTLALGRQRLTASSRRYVGSINWRLNEQTFDALTAVHDFGNGIDASYAYVSNVNRVFGPKDGSPPADLGGGMHLVDVKRVLAGGTRLWGYGHFLDFDTAPELSTATVGLRVDSEYSISDELRVPFVADIARQRDRAGNPFDYAVSYWRLESGLEWNDLSLLAGIEVLEGTGRTGEAFSTPLAGLHGQNGWADQFLTTPPGGLEDRHIKLVRTIGSGRLDVHYHDYSASTGRSNYGTELGISFGWPVTEHYSLLIKTANYRAEDFAADVRKFWIMITADF